MRLIAIFFGLGVFAADGFTKWWVKNVYYYPVIDGFFSIHYVQNRGIAFGLFHDLDSHWKPVILSLLALLAMGVVLYYIWTTSQQQRLLFVAFGLLLGGILGNFTDRLLHQYVVDFLEFRWGNRFAWPTFNIADAAITCGVGIILFETFFGKEPASTPAAEVEQVHEDL